MTLQLRVAGDGVAEVLMQLELSYENYCAGAPVNQS